MSILFDTQVKIGISDADFQKGIATAGAAVKDFALMGGRALADFAKNSIATGEQFDASMAQVAATMGSTVDQIGELRDYAKEMGRTTAFSATQAAQALNFMALAGYDAATSMEMLPNVLNLAASGGMELATASDMITDAQSALGLSLDETSELVDKMAAAASHSNTSVSQLGSAILTVGGTAKNLKGGTTELATALGILANNGIKGAEGGTALRNILNSLAAPTGDAAETLEALNVEVYDAEGNMRSLNDIFGDMKYSLDQLSQKDRMQAISNMFNLRDMKSAEALLGGVGTAYNDLASSIDNAAGSAGKMAETQLDNLQGDLTKMQSALEGVKLMISDTLTPGLRGLTKFGTKWITRIADAMETGDPKAVTRAFLHMVKNGVRQLREDIPEIAVTIYDEFLKPVGEEIFESSKRTISSFAVYLKENLPELIPIGVEAVVEFTKGLTEPESYQWILNAAGDVINGLVNGLLSEKTLNAILDGAPVIVENLVTGINNALPKMEEVAANIYGKIIDYFGNEENRKKLEEVSDKILKTLFDGMVDILTKGTYNFGGLIAEQIGLGEYWQYGNDVLQEWWDGFKVKWEEFKEWFHEEVTLTLNPIKFGQQFGEMLGEWFGDDDDSGPITKEDIGPMLKIIKEHLFSIDSNADGGYVSTPRLSWVAEKEPEYIIPESKMDKVFGRGGNTYNITVNMSGSGNTEEDARNLAELSIQQIRAIGGTGF